MVHHPDHRPVLAGPLRRGQTECGGSSGGEGSSINAIIMEPTRLFVDDAPVSAGPLRRGQTVCGGSSSSNDIEGSSSKDVVEERPLEEILEERPLSVRTEINKVVIDDVVAIPSGLAKDLDNIYTPTAQRSAMHELELLPDDEYMRGNVRKYPSGITLPIDAAAADNMRQGRRKNRQGLCYEEHGFDGFSPASWPHVFAAPASGFGHHDAMLQQHPALGTFGYTQVSVILTVIYEAKPNPKLVGVAETFWEAHKPVRDTDPSAGGMVGTGEHLRRDGHVANVVVADAEARARVAGGMECAGNSFVKRWTGAHVGFEELLGHQWQARRNERAKCTAKVKERSGTRRRQARTTAADGGRQR